MPEDNEDKPQVVTIADLPRTRSEGFVSVYANHTEAYPGFYEIALLFCRIGKARPGQMAIEEGAEIALSWEHALRVRDLLNRMIDAYEKQQGKIRIQEGNAPESSESGDPEHS
jgi:hypothetical protein